ncbi:MAG: hypothetical protein HZA17_12965 [Nitrospirae bacterium]|nr:hypothetical protein [Nitrospirota bacterium]
MGIVSSLAGVFSKERALQKALIKKMKGLPEEEMDIELGLFLHDQCVRHASEFVKAELVRGDSPFRGLEEYRFFHEVMFLNLWIVDKVVSQKKKGLIEQVRRNYLKAFHYSGERENELLDTLAERYRTYYDFWNEHTGHHDIFGERFTEIIFGKDSKVPVAETSFWIISYTDSTIKAFTDIKKICRSAGIKL